MLDVSIVTITTVINLALAGLVLVRNARETRNRLLAGFIAALTLWSVLNYLADSASSFNLLFTRLTFASAMLLGIGIVTLSVYFPITTKVLTKVQLQLYILLASLVGVASLTPYLAHSVVKTSAGVQIEIGGLYYPYLIFVLFSMTIAVRNFYYQYKSGNAVEKIQVKYVLIGFISLALFGVTAQLILPTLVDSWSSTRYGPVFTTVFVFFLAVAIVKHRLLDIKLVVARAFVYIVSLLGIGFFYILFVFGIAGLFINISNISRLQQIVFTLLALVTAMTYSPLVRFFNKQTNKFFYRDAYETQDILDKVSGVIVGSVDPHKVQKGALSALSAAFKPSYITFLLVEHNEKLRHGDTLGQAWKMHDPELLQPMLKKTGKRVVLFDEIEAKNGNLRDILRTEDISVIAPLVTKDETIGYLIIGPKKSGNIYTSQDVGLLNIASNELAVALQNAQRFEEIQAFNLTLQEKVTEATRELKLSNKKLIALDEAKDEFISMASHQLRTPLTSIKGYLSMMVEGDLGKVTPAQEKALKEAFGSSQRMVYLIADFLNVSRIKTGKFMIETKEVDLPLIVSEEITQLREMADSRDLKLVYSQPEGFPRVKLDDNKIRQVMMNMVDNAIYYTPAGGTITIQLYATGQEVIFKVVDNGIGVPKKEQHKLFTKFYRAGNARKSRPDGTGLGLFMAQKIVVEQGGVIIFESEEGKGSTFGFRFPLSKIKA